jgi:hypothetical protein
VPALQNHRHEAFAAAIVMGLAGQYTTQGTAYVAAGYKAKDAGKAGGSAEASASRLLKKVKTITDRVLELQAELAARKKVTIETIADELDEARSVAKANDQAAAMVSASATKARLYGLEVRKIEQGSPGDFSQVQSSNELVDRVLKEHGAEHITDSMRALALGEISRHGACIAAIASGKQANA